jgi:aspartate/methionine/tyrosine aminotransferase
VAARRTVGDPLIDLTVSNPTSVGLTLANAETLRSLADPRGAEDHPDPRGLSHARAAVAHYYTARGTPVDAERILLTTGTSESYAHLFRLLGEPGDVVLAPTPGYPLIEPIARLEGLEVVHYRLAWDGAWHLDLASLDAALEAAGTRARAVVVIEPNHPTGTCLAHDEREALESRLEARGLALISDEVFADFPWPPRREVFAGWLGARRVPTFVLGGLSKCCGLPQLKLGWIALAGPEAMTEALIQRLEWIADLFLTVGAPVQHAAASWLEVRGAYQARVLERVAANRRALGAFVRERPEVASLGGEGGWSTVLRLPAAAVNDWALVLLERDVIVHPGHFYDLEQDGAIVVSLIPEPEPFTKGLRRISEVLGAI